jgi:hypothetical protein
MATDQSKQIDVETLENASGPRIVKGEETAVFEGLNEEEMKALESKCNTSHFQN